jgi:hypothetical protein
MMRELAIGPKAAPSAPMPMTPEVNSSPLPGIFFVRETMAVHTGPAQRPRRKRMRVEMPIPEMSERKNEVRIISADPKRTAGQRVKRWGRKIIEALPQTIPPQKIPILQAALYGGREKVCSKYGADQMEAVASTAT